MGGGVGGFAGRGIAIEVGEVFLMVGGVHGS